MNSSRSMRQNRDDYYNPQVVEGSLQGGSQNYYRQQRTRPRRMEIFGDLLKHYCLIGVCLSGVRHSFSVQ